MPEKCYEKHMEICNKLNEIYTRKNKDYGSSFDKTFDRFGAISIAIRLSDKMERFANLSLNDGVGLVKDESMIDTLYDMANYAIMGIMRLEDKNHE